MQPKTQGEKVWLHRGVKTPLQLYTPDLQVEHAAYQKLIDKHENQFGAVGLAKLPFWKRYLELNEISKDQNFAEIESDALDYAMKSKTGELFSIALPQGQASKYYAGTPTLRTEGGGGPVFHIPAIDLAQMVAEGYEHSRIIPSKLPIAEAVDPADYPMAEIIEPFARGGVISPEFKDHYKEPDANRPGKLPVGKIISGPAEANLPMAKLMTTTGYAKGGKISPLEQQLAIWKSWQSTEEIPYPTAHPDATSDETITDKVKHATNHEGRIPAHSRPQGQAYQTLACPPWTYHS